MHSSLSCPPPSEPSDEPCFQAHEWTPPSSSPPLPDPFFPTSHLSSLSTPLPPLPSPPSLTARLSPTTLPFSRSPPSLSLPSLQSVLVCDLPRFQAPHLAPPSSSPPVSESSFVTCHVSKLTNSLLPLPPLQSVSP